MEVNSTRCIRPWRGGLASVYPTPRMGDGSVLSLGETLHHLKWTVLPGSGSFMPGQSLMPLTDCAHVYDHGVLVKRMKSGLSLSLPRLDPDGSLGD